MKIRRQAFLLSLLPALCLPGLPAAVTAASWHLPSPVPGRYSGPLSMTIMHAGSASGGGISTEWHFEMVGSIGTIDIGILRLGSWAAVVNMPVPIDHLSSASISDEASKCKSYRVASWAFGKAEGSGNGPSSPGQGVSGDFVIDSMEFTLSSMRARITKQGECPSEGWGPKSREAIDSDFAAIFGSKWTFAVMSATPDVLAGTCESASFGKSKGETLSCGWRAYSMPAE